MSFRNFRPRPSLSSTLMKLTSRLDFAFRWSPLRRLEFQTKEGKKLSTSSFFSTDVCNRGESKGFDLGSVSFAREEDWESLLLLLLLDSRLQSTSLANTRVPLCFWLTDWRRRILFDERKEREVKLGIQVDRGREVEEELEGEEEKAVAGGCDNGWSVDVEITWREEWLWGALSWACFFLSDSNLRVYKSYLSNSLSRFLSLFSKASGFRCRAS